MAVAVGTTLVGLAAVAAIHPGSGGRSTEGPLKVPPAHGSSVTLPVGTEFTDGFEILSLSGDTAAVIDSVELVDSPGFELLGTRLVSPARKLGFVQFVRGWPPASGSLRTAPVILAEGATITPTILNDGAGWELLVGIRVTGSGLLRRAGLKVDYTVGGEKFTATFPAEMVVCTDPRYEVRGRCPLGG